MLNMDMQRAFRALKLRRSSCSTFARSTPASRLFESDRAQLPDWPTRGAPLARPHRDHTSAAFDRNNSTSDPRGCAESASLVGTECFVSKSAQETWPVPRREATVGDISTTVLLTKHEPATRCSSSSYGTTASSLPSGVRAGSGPRGERRRARALARPGVGDRARAGRGGARGTRARLSPRLRRLPRQAVPLRRARRAVAVDQGQVIRR